MPQQWNDYVHQAPNCPLLFYSLVGKAISGQLFNLFFFFFLNRNLRVVILCAVFSLPFAVELIVECVQLKWSLCGTDRRIVICGEVFVISESETWGNLTPMNWKFWSCWKEEEEKENSNNLSSWKRTGRKVFLKLKVGGYHLGNRWQTAWFTIFEKKQFSCIRFIFR